MDSGIDIKAVLMANLLSFMLMVLLFSTNYWRKNSRNKEDRLLLYMIIICMVTCISDPITYIVDGHDGLIFTIVVYASNSWIFVVNLIVGPIWVTLISEHLGVIVNKVHKLVLSIVCALGFITLVANLFVPLVFSVDSGNVYARGPLYWLFMVIEFFFITDGLIIYFRAKSRGGMLKFFPLWQFLIPVIVGILVQTIFYGVSAIWPCFTVAVCGLVLSLQNELVFKDSLTGIYNRSYLDNLKNQITDSNKGSLTVMMLDMNEFKSINDNHGHAAGDDALISASNIISKAVGNLGTVIRYAGDEFVILLNTQDEEMVNNCISDIRTSIDEFNKNAGKAYRLSVSIGQCPMNLNEQTIDEILNKVDRLMYEDKMNYYKMNDRRKRR